MTDPIQIAEIFSVLTRIADALDRAYPLPTEKAPTKRKTSTPVLKSDIESAIDFINKKTGRGFSAFHPNGRITAGATKARNIMQKGYTLQQIKTVIAYMAKEWGDDDMMAKYLTPDTLFRPSKFEKYLGKINGG